MVELTDIRALVLLQANYHSPESVLLGSLTEADASWFGAETQERNVTESGRQQQNQTHGFTCHPHQVRTWQTYLLLIKYCRPSGFGRIVK